MVVIDSDAFVIGFSCSDQSHLFFLALTGYPSPSISMEEIKNKPGEGHWFERRDTSTLSPSQIGGMCTTIPSAFSDMAFKFLLSGLEKSSLPGMVIENFDLR